MAAIDILYVSSAPTPAAFDEIRGALKPGVQSVSYGMAEASFKFHNLLRNGLAAEPGVRMTSLVGRSVNPKFHAGRWWPAREEEVETNQVARHVAVPNAPVLKQVWAAAALGAGARAWMRRTAGSPLRVVVVDAAYVTALPTVLAATATSEVLQLGIFCDIYSYMGNVGDAANRAGVKRSVVRRAAAKIYRQFDGFIVLTEAMNDVVNRGGKRSALIEGIADDGMLERPNNASEKADEFTFFYGGALRREYGLADLIDGFMALPEPHARLRIMGAGDFAGEVERAASTDPRIVFDGYQPLPAVIEAQMQSWVLVNPRPATAEFTKYSFPSKVMEYLASGTPVLTTRLPGIPAEYASHVDFIEGAGPEAVTSALARMMQMSAAELHVRGDAAKQFVMASKTPDARARQVLQMVGDIVRSRRVTGIGGRTG